MPKRNFYNDHKGDGINIPRAQVAFNLGNPNHDVSAVQHHIHMGNVILTPKYLGHGTSREMFPDSRKA